MLIKACECMISNTLRMRARSPPSSSPPIRRPCTNPPASSAPLPTSLPASSCSSSSSRRPPCLTGTAPGSRSGAPPAPPAPASVSQPTSAINYPNAGYNNNNARREPVSSNHRCCAERRLLDTWIDAARRHGVPQHKVVPWVRRKLGPVVVVLRFRSDGQLGCSVPCVLCQRELERFDLSVHCYVGDDGAPGEQHWFRGRLSDAGAPTSVLTAGQRRTLNLDPPPPKPLNSHNHKPPLKGNPKNNNYKKKKKPAHR